MSDKCPKCGGGMTQTGFRNPAPYAAAPYMPGATDFSKWIPVYTCLKCDPLFVTGSTAFAIDNTTLAARVAELENAIRNHRSQKADDRCIEDDDQLYEALGDGIKCDRRVGDQCAMLENCKRFIERRTEGGGWPTYAELETMLMKCGRHAPDCATALNQPDEQRGDGDYFDCNCGWNSIRDRLWPEAAP